MLCAGSFYDRLCELPKRCDSYLVCFYYGDDVQSQSHWASPDTCDYDSGVDNDGEEWECIEICFGDGNFSTVEELRDVLDSLTDEYGYNIELNVCLSEDDNGDWHDLLEDDPHIDHRRHRVTYYVE